MNEQEDAVFFSGVFLLVNHGCFFLNHGANRIMY